MNYKTKLEYSLDTLAQPDTNFFDKGFLIDKTLQKRANRKQYTQKITAELLQLKSPLHKQYQRAYYCCNGLKQEGKTITTTNEYCNSRTCMVCNSIRTAKLINGYGEHLQLEKQYFCTLTIVNVSKDELRKTIEIMIKQFGLILKQLRQKKGLHPDGIRRLEITYNKQNNTYHPHFHFLINCEASANFIQTQWLKRWPTAKDVAQDIREANEETLHEIFKYSTKFAVKLEENEQTNYEIHVSSLDTIFCAMNGKRTVQPFGKYVKKKISEDISKEDVKETEYNVELKPYAHYEWKEYDWFDIKTGEALSNAKKIDAKFYVVDKTPPIPPALPPELKQLKIFLN